MKNEIGRKITSLTLMTIMLAGGMTIAFPGFTPDAYAVNANLYVSAENTGGYVDGAQIVEIVVIDNDLSGSPDITVNGDAVAMTKADDSNWYAYIADTSAVEDVDNAENNVSGIDFGALNSVNGTGACSITSNDSGAEYVYCDAVGGDDQNVPAAEKTAEPVNTSWPFIQTYAFSSTIEIQYNTAGSTQIETLSFDDNAGGLSLDRSTYPLGADVHVTIEDHRLNIDPTSADIWLWNMDTGDKYYGSGAVTAINVDNQPNVNLAEAISTSIEASLAYAEVVASNAAIITSNTTQYVDGLDNPIGTITDAIASISNENDKIIASLNIIKDADASAHTEDAATNAFAEVAKIGNFYQRIDETYEATTNPIPILNLGLADLDTLSTTATEANSAIAAAKAAVNTVAKTNQVCVDCTVSITSNRLNTSGPDVLVVSAVDNRPLPITDPQWFTVRESEPNTAVFSATNLDDDSILRIADDVIRGSSALITYGVGADAVDTDVNVKHSEATIEIQSPDDVWTSGLAVPIVVVDGDVNKNSQSGDDIDVADPDSIIPTLITGTPFTLGTIPSGITWWVGLDTLATLDNHGSVEQHSATVETFSERANIAFNEAVEASDFLLIDFGNNADQLRENLIDEDGTTKRGHNFINYDFESLEADVESIEIFVGGANGTVVDTISLDANEQRSGYKPAFTDNWLFNTTASKLEIKLNFEEEGLTIEDFSKDYPIVIDFFSFGIDNDGEASDERIANQIIRLELEESDSDTGSLEGTLEYVMINQLIIVGDEDVYGSISPIGKDVSFIVIEDLTGGSAPSVTYRDLDANGAVTPVSAQEDAPSHSAVVTLNVDSLKTADTVTVTLEDLDLNTDSGLPDIYTVVTHGADPSVDSDATNRGAVGSPYTEASLLSDGSSLGRLLDITFDDQRWMTHTDTDGTACTAQLEINDQTGLDDTDFSLIETGDATGIFVGTFAIPAEFCRQGSTEPESVTGLDIEVNYVDFRDQSGETTEVGDGAGVKATTGSVSLDRTVYPVPFGVVRDFDPFIDATTPADGNIDTRSLFPIHQNGMSDAGDLTSGLDDGEFLPQGDLIVYVTVADPDFDVSASGKDSIQIDSCFTNPENKRDRECRLTQADGHTQEVDRSPVTVSVIRGSQDITVARIGGSDSPIDEIAPDAGIFESAVTIRYHDGPDSTLCPTESEPGNTPDPLLNGRIGDHDNKPDTPDEWISSIDPRKDYCILQGDILQVEYNDPTDASGQPNTVTDSATFDLRNGVLQSDKSVYIIGSDMILTLIEPDLDLDSSQNETYDLDLIKWSSSAATLTMGDASEDEIRGAFDPEPLSFRETGPSTGIFQIVIEIPDELDGSLLQRGEEIDLEYTDWGPAGSDYVGDQDEDIRLTVFTSNFGATIDLDQKVYSWTDKVYITIVAPDHNFDNDLIDEIGQDDEDPLRVATKGFDLDNYRLVETGFDTGIFTGEVILTGFAHNPVGKGEPLRGGAGPTDGFLPTPRDGGISVSYEFSEDETVFTSSIIRWNIGDVQWLEASYPASGTGVLRVIDPDMNLNPEAVDNFDANVASHTDASGITLTLTETNEATGIFEGTIFFTTTGGSSGHRLRVSEGDTVTADYSDSTLPLPYTTSDRVSITSTTIIGTIVPPLERAPATNLRIVNTFGNSIDTVAVDQQVQITADLSNGQDRDQDFAYLIQIQDSDGVTVSLSWIAGSLSPGQSFSPSASWTPTSAGTYDVTAFVWESIDNPTALSPPLSIDVSVN